MADYDHDSMQNRLAKLRTAVAADITRHVASLLQSGIDPYGYALLPPDYYTAFDPSSITVAYNVESNIALEYRDLAYYRFSVDEWQNYVRDGFAAVNAELSNLKSVVRSSTDDSLDDDIVAAIYQAFLDALASLRADGTFDNISYLVIWLSDSGDRITNRSARLLNVDETYSAFAAEFVC